MVDNSQIIVEYSELRNRDIANELLRSKTVTCSITEKQARRIKRDWDKYGAYKTAYYQGDSKKGLWLSFIWIVSNIYTSFAFGELEKISSLYYDYAHRLTPVEFKNAGPGNVLVTFRLKQPVDSETI